MKIRMQSLFALFMLLISSLGAKADSFSFVQGTFVISCDGSNATITEWHPVSSVTSLVVPDKVNYNGKSYPVAAIDLYSSSLSKTAPNLAQVTLGVNVRTIGEKCF